MFSSSPDAFLRIDCTLQLGKITVRVHSAQKDGLVLKGGGGRGREGENVEKSKLKNMACKNFLLTTNLTKYML